MLLIFPTSLIAFNVLLDMLTIGALCFFTFPILSIFKAPARNERVTTLKAWCLIIIALINIFVSSARFLLRDSEINFQTLKKLTILLTFILGVMAYGISSLLTQIFLEKEVDAIFAYQAFIAICTWLLLGKLLFFIQHSQTLESRTSSRSIPPTDVLLVLALVYMLYKTEFLDLNSKEKQWVRISILLTIGVSSSFQLISSRKILIAFVPVPIYWCLQGMSYIMQAATAFKSDNLHFLIFCSWMLFFWGIVPAVIQSVLRIVELLISSFKRRRNRLFSLKQINLKEAKNKTCSICWEEFQSSDNLMARTSCLHCYHEICLKQWVERDSRCPLCRGLIHSDLSLVSCRNELRTPENFPHLFSHF